ncbi:MAG TPA: hypothetical protein VFZ68_18305 [Acidimicrobiales bacterium]
MGATVVRAARSAVELVAALLGCTARVAGRLVGRVVRLVRVVGWWLTCGAVCWLVLRLVGLPTAAATAVVSGVGLVAGALVWWALVVEPWLFAPRPSTRPQVVTGPSRRPVSADEVDHVEFARALSLVADRYLAECEHRAGLDERGQW